MALSGLDALHLEKEDIKACLLLLSEALKKNSPLSFLAE
jgi:hypothetical protein